MKNIYYGLVLLIIGLMGMGYASLDDYVVYERMNDTHVKQTTYIEPHEVYYNETYLEELYMRKRIQLRELRVVDFDSKMQKERLVEEIDNLQRFIEMLADVDTDTGKD